jgi:cytochrome c-type biogenesis protein CcmH
MTIGRRAWVRSAGLAIAGLVVGRRAGTQQATPQAAGIPDTSNLFAMDQSAARSVRLPAKPGARPTLTPAERDDLEHRIRCQCGCTLDVYTCRTTDFSCQVSPSMHRDIMALIDGGYDAREILDAFVNVYGERALMAPTREGFNLLAWILPGSAIAVGAVVLGALIRRWHRPRPAEAPLVVAGPQATPDELARLEAAIRNDDD